MEIISQGAEATIELKDGKIFKFRKVKSYRNSKLDEKDIVLFDELAYEHFEIAKLSQKDFARTQRRYENHIQPHIGYKNILEITKWDVEHIIKLMISKGLKPATVETGAVVQVPLFVEIGDTIKIDTRKGDYLGRV